MKVLIGAPVREPVPVLSAFLRGLSGLQLGGLTPDWLFLDDCDDGEARACLTSWRPPAGTLRLAPAGGQAPPYARDEQTHRWTDPLWMRLGGLRDRLLRAAREGGYDALLLCDADLVLHPQTLAALCSTGKDIVAEVFWTSWSPEGPELPNVWCSGHYTLFPWTRGEQVPAEQARRRTAEWLGRLRQPGCYPVGGLGALTLIRRAALERPISYGVIPTLELWGEDRHFCVRAQALGLSLWADTRAPALHLYRASDLQRLDDEGLAG